MLNLDASPGVGWGWGSLARPGLERKVLPRKLGISALALVHENNLPERLRVL